MTNLHSLPNLTYKLRIDGPEALKSMSLEELAVLKSQLDTDLNTLFEKLASLNANMDTDLFTLDGFPRNDIDVATIRNVRSTIRKLQNDYKWISEHLLAKMNEKFSQ